MTQLLSNSYPTKFGMYACCDRETYRKIKAIRRFYETALVWANRWEKAQKRLPHNRYFKLRSPGGKKRFDCKDSWIFSPFWTICEGGTTTNWRGQTVTQPRFLEATPLLRRFLEDHRNAKQPRQKAEDVRPLFLSTEQIDQLLADIQKWAETPR